MIPLVIERKDDTPQVTLDKENATFEIIGRSLPEDTLSFYVPIYDWLQEYIKEPNDQTILTINIDYFNSSSQKAINDLLEILTYIKKIEKKILINWYYMEDDEDMYEVGVDYADLTRLDFVYKCYIPD